MPALSGPPRLRVTTKIGLILMLLCVSWWFAYYAQYESPAAFLQHKIWCIAATTDACAFYAQHIISSLPDYSPWLWWLGLLLALFGKAQRSLERLLHDGEDAAQ
ncbi:hypothetical protein [Methylocapsa sp. S129]|uniref:hypothetical protein n=1 Tax=Methylocapsa sp. S129 TaxID=1641869 RepID=UPI00131A958F|nr:hypothetical protein [Methylocapsa sp. S129]